MILKFCIKIYGVFQDYEFLDLSDVKDADLNTLQCALYDRIPDISATALAGGWNEPTIGKCHTKVSSSPIIRR